VGGALYEELLSKLAQNFRTLPDKPEESAESTLRALFSAAAGQPRSVVLAGALPLAELDGADERS